MSKKSYYDEYDRGFLDAFDPDAITVLDRVSTRADRSVSPQDAEVFRVESNGERAYFVDISREDGAWGQENRPVKVSNAYRAAIRLGVSVPIAVITDDWWAVKEFDWKQLYRYPKPVAIRISDELDTDRFTWDCAKLLLLGYKDAGVYNCLFSPTGEYVHIDMQALNDLVRPRYYQFVMALTYKLEAIDLDPDLYHQIERRAVALAYYLQEHDTIDAYMSPEIESNIEQVPELLPVNSHTPLDRDSLPSVDETVIPSNPVNLE